MYKPKPLHERLYQDEVYIAVARAVGYFGITYRELCEVIETFWKMHGKSRVESANFTLCTFEGQNTVNPKPLVKVELRAETRKLCHMLLGPAPETWDRYYCYADGTPTPEHETRMADLERQTGNRPEPKPKAARPKATKAKEGPAIQKQPKGKRKTS